jgi:CRP-like cAMP-binding protein
VANTRSNRSLSVPSPGESGNLLLEALPADDYARIVPNLAVVPLRLKQILHQPGNAIRHVYFPAGGFCSELTVLADGRMVEVATIGREGVVGVFGDPGNGPVRSATMVQAAGASVQMPAALFRGEMDRRGAFFGLVSAYRLALVRFIMQSTACNAVHSAEERFARWLLTAQDHVRAAQFSLTQELAAMMLGVTRPTLSEVAATLQRTGLITYRRGCVTIVDRGRLEGAACECYAVTAAIVDGLGPARLRAPSDRHDAPLRTPVKRVAAAVPLSPALRSHGKEAARPRGRTRLASTIAGNQS